MRQTVSGIRRQINDLYNTYLGLQRFLEMVRKEELSHSYSESIKLDLEKMIKTISAEITSIEEIEYDLRHAREEK